MTARLAAAFAAALAGTSCSLQQAAPPDPGIALPPGPARAILVDACLGCHDLGGLVLFGSFYTRADWHELVLTMVAHGAELDDADVELVTDYLGEHFAAD